MLIDWKGLLQSDSTSSLKEGPKWCAGHQEYDRVHMTKTPYYSNSRSLPGIFRVTNQQNNRPFLGGGVALCRGYSRPILFVANRAVRFLKRTAGGDLISKHHHPKLIKKKLPPGGHHKGL